MGRWIHTDTGMLPALISGCPIHRGTPPTAVAATPRAALALYLNGGSFHHAMDTYYDMAPICLIVTREDPDAVATVRFILQHLGVDVNCEYDQGWTALIYASYDARTSMAIMLVDEFGANVNVMTDPGYSPLHYAARTNCEALTAFLLDRGADPLLHKFPDRSIQKEVQSAAVQALMEVAIERRRHEADCSEY